MRVRAEDVSVFVWALARVRMVSEKFVTLRAGSARRHCPRPRALPAAGALTLSNEGALQHGRERWCEMTVNL